MTVLFLLALASLILVMKLVCWFMPVEESAPRPLVLSVLPSPTSFRRSQPATNIRRVLCRTALLFGATALGYLAYWQLVRSFHIRGIVQSYLGAPILVLAGELLAAVITVLFLPSGHLFPALHQRPWLARGVADFWGKRWNLWFSDWFRYVLFQRLRRRPALAAVLVFVISGLMHEWVINAPLYFVTGRVLFGSMMIYFLLQAAGVLLERRFFRKRSCAKILFAWLVVFVPSPLILNEGLLRALCLWPQ